MKICLLKEMVEDGAVPQLGVGDEWLVELMFQPDLPMVRTTSDFALGMWPLVPLDADTTARYHITAEVVRRQDNDAKMEWTAVEFPGVMLGLESTFPLPEGRRVHGSGLVRVDPWSNVAEIFPETKRRCVVESLTCINVPPFLHEDGRLYPDWPRHERRSIGRIRIRNDFPLHHPDAGFYSVQIALV